MADSQTILIGLSGVRSDTVQWSGSQYVIGDGAGASKSLCFSNSNGLTLYANPSTTRTISLPDSDGTVGILAGVAVGTAGTVSNGGFSFRNSNNITFGMSGSTITGAIGSASMFSNHRTDQNNSANTNSTAVGAASIQRVYIPNILATRMDLLGSLTVAGSTAGTYGLYVGLYTFAGSTASSLSSASVSVSWNSGTNSTAVSIYGGQSGLRPRSIPLGTWAFAAGEYLIAAMITQGGVAGTTGSWSFYGAGAGIASSAPAPGGGAYSAYFADGIPLVSFGTDFPSSIHLSNIDQTVSHAQYQPGFRLIGTGP